MERNVKDIHLIGTNFGFHEIIFESVLGELLL